VPFGEPSGRGRALASLVTRPSSSLIFPLSVPASLTTSLPMPPSRLVSPWRDEPLRSSAQRSATREHSAAIPAPHCVKRLVSGRLINGHPIFRGAEARPTTLLDDLPSVAVEQWVFRHLLARLEYPASRGPVRTECELRCTSGR
jgi:hypothetical protein